MKLYPIKFDPILKSLIWGGAKICEFKGIASELQNIGESWEIADVNGDISVVSEGELAGKSLQELIDEFGAQLLGKENLVRFDGKFPLLIKFIDASDALSIQVHPDNALSRARHGSSGKTEMWYVVSAEPGAELFSGFSETITPDEYEKRLSNNTLTDVINKHQVQAGDCFFVPAGCIHALGKGVFIAEIQQASDITYRIFDYNRQDDAGKTRELHTELAKEALDFSAGTGGKIDYLRRENEVMPLASCSYFTTNLLRATAPLSRDYSGMDSFVVYICLSGQVSIETENAPKTALKQGETLLVPAACKQIQVVPELDCKLLEAFIL